VNLKPVWLFASKAEVNGSRSGHSGFFLVRVRNPKDVKIEFKILPSLKTVLPKEKMEVQRQQQDVPEPQLEIESIEDRHQELNQKQAETEQKWHCELCFAVMEAHDHYCHTCSRQNRKELLQMTVILATVGSSVGGSIALGVMDPSFLTMIAFGTAWSISYLRRLCFW
jgi:hypothetical protein